MRTISGFTFGLWSGGVTFAASSYITYFAMNSAILDILVFAIFLPSATNLKGNYLISIGMFCKTAVRTKPYCSKTLFGFYVDHNFTPSIREPNGSKREVLFPRDSSL